MSRAWRIFDIVERARARFRVFGLTLGLVVGLILVTVGIAGTWHDSTRPVAKTFEISPGTATDGHLTIRLTGVLLIH